MKFHFSIRWTLACVVMLAARPTPTRGEPAASPPPAASERQGSPSLREIWVPAGDLRTVLGRYPRAVSLSREQLFSLLRDAHADDANISEFVDPPPVRAAIRQATFEGWLAPGPNGQTQVRVEGRVEVEALADAWTDVSLGLRGIALGTAEIDGGGVPASVPGAAGLRRAGGNSDGPVSIAVHGRGVHRLRLGFVLPVKTGPDESSIVLPTLAGVGEFLLHLPAGTRAESPSGCAVQSDASGLVARVALLREAAVPAISPTAISDFGKPGHSAFRNPSPAEPARLNWRTAPPASQEEGALLQSGRVEIDVNASEFKVRQEIVLRPALGQLPASALIPLPAGAGAVRVEGESVARWDLGADGLSVALTHGGGDHDGAAFTVFYEFPNSLVGSKNTVDQLASGPAVASGSRVGLQIGLEVLQVAGAHRVTGELLVRHGPGVTLKRVAPGRALVPAPGGTFSSAEETAPGFVAAFLFSDLPPPRTATDAGPRNTSPLTVMLDVWPARTRFNVDADARADFQLDGVHIARTLAFQVEEGDLFTALVKLPAGETVSALRATGGGKEPDWRQTGDELLLNWTTGLPESSKTGIAIDSRAELVPPKPGTPVDFSLGAALVPGAERLTGYIALASASAFRLVTVGGEDRLERRDGRATPVRGDVAWFYRDDFRLALRIERRTEETEARFTGYALPLAGAVEIHAQIGYRFRYSGVESVQVRVPRESADAFLFTGEHIAERRRDDDVWTIRFQGEQSGDYALGVQATIPAPADPGDAQRFHFRLPVIVPAGSAHWSGTWAVEANTDTEIRFNTTGANEVDTLHAPPLAGYQPRRRVIGVFEFLGGTTDIGIDLDGVRHAAAGGASAVVDRLDLETDASTSGVLRHRAAVRARTVGDGFFNLHLPPGATLWSLTLDGEPVKPVSGAGTADLIRVELPGGRSAANPSVVVVVYETPGQPWTGAGWRSVVAPRFDDGVPVLQSHWTLCVPDGFDYRFAHTPSGAGLAEPKSGDLLIPRMATALGHMTLWAYDHAWFSVSAYKTGLRTRDALLTVAQESVELDPADPASGLPQAAQMDSAATKEATLKATPDASVTINPKPLPRLEAVKKYLLEAGQFYDTGRFDLSFKRYEQVLSLDPYNDAARRGEERVDLARTRHSEKAGYPETRGRLIAETAPAWELQALRSNLDADPRRNYQKLDDNTGTASITRKLQSIVIPNIEFRQTTLNDAVEFLRQEARRLDTQSLEEERGVNIFLKLSTSDAGTPAVGIPGLPPGTEMTAQAPSTPVATGKTRISLNLSNIPLLTVLDYTAKAANLKLKVEPYAVSLVPLTEETGDMVTVEVRIPPSFLGVAPSQTPSTASTNGTADVTGTGSGTLMKREDAKAFLESSGVTFPPGSSAVYLASTSQLVVRNTQANIDLVTALTSPAGGSQAPSQLPTLDGRENPKGVPGLLPLRLDLPTNGIAYEFDGDELYALDFYYVDWAVAARWRWIFLTLGAFAFLFGAAGWAHPWRRTLYAILALTFFPLIVAPAATVPCNALLAGWLWAVAGWCLTRFLLRRRRLAAVIPLVCGAMWIAAASAEAAPKSLPAPTPASSPELVIVPYDATKPVAGQAPTNLYLPYERFLVLWDAAKRHRRPPAPEPPPGGERYALGAARYDARLIGDTLEIDATLDLQTFGDGWIGVPLGFEPNRVGTMTLDAAPAALGGDGLLWIGKPGGHRVTVALRVPAAGVAAGTQLSWSVPPTVATLVTLLIPRSDLQAELHGSTSDTGEVEEIGPEGRRLTASLGGSSTVALTFRDAPSPAPVAGQPALASVDARLTASARQETLDALIRFSFPGNTQDHFTVLLDGSLTLTGLDAPDVRQWHLSTGGDRQTLEISLNVPARDGYRLVLTADRPLDALPATGRNFPLVSAQSVRVERTAALLTEGAVEISLPDGPPAGMRRVGVANPDRGHAFAAFAGDGAAAIRYSVRAADGKRTAHINYLYQVGRGKIELAASVRLSPAAGEPLTTTDLRLPAGFAVQAVVGAAVQQWWRDGDVLSLRFHPGRDQTDVPLLVYLVRQYERAPERFTLQGLVASGFAVTEGETVVAADGSFKVGLNWPAGIRSEELSEIKAATAAREFEVRAPLQRQRAFRYHGAEFEVTATLENQPARWQAQWVTQATVRDGAVTLETHVNATMLQGAVDALEFSLPAGLTEAHVSGPDVRETVVSGSGDGRRTYRVLFQNGLYAGAEAGFTISQELSLDASNRAALPDLTFPGEGGRAATGFVLVENASAGEMTLDPHGLEPAIESEVPFLPPLIVAGTRFFRASPGVPWSLGVRVTNLEKTAGRAALVAYAELTTTLRTNGEEWHRAAYRLQNRRLQFLPVELPAGMELIGVRVAGESVRVDAGPGEKDTAPLLLVPLVKTRPGEMSYDVELIYRRPVPQGAMGRDARAFGHWKLEDPRLPGIPIEKTLWDIYVPAGARLLDSGGNLEPVVAALSATEKLESALSDLRELSATYRSAGASDSDRRRALDNYNTLAAQVTRQANLKPSGRGMVEAEPQGSVFKKANVETQNATASQRQQAILSTVDSLSAANITVDQSRLKVFSAGGTTSAGQQFDGFINYGSPISALSSTGTVGGQVWRDNRVTDTQVTAGETTLRATAPREDRNIGRDVLVLNDSVTVNLPAKEADEAGKVIDSRTTTTEVARRPAPVAQSENRLSTARANQTNETPAAPVVAAAAPAAPPAATPAGPGAANVPVEDRKPRSETLRSEGHISLSVDFPLEGQVYHFKKINADARLTLWTVQPSRFIRLAWLAVLLVGLALLWIMRRIIRRRRLRPVPSGVRARRPVSSASVG